MFAQVKEPHPLLRTVNNADLAKPRVQAFGGCDFPNHVARMLNSLRLELMDEAGLVLSSENCARCSPLILLPLETGRQVVVVRGVDEAQLWPMWLRMVNVFESFRCMRFERACCGAIAMRAHCSFWSAMCCLDYSVAMRSRVMRSFCCRPMMQRPSR